MAKFEYLDTTGTTRVFVATTSVDLRGSFNRLYSLPVEHLKGAPLSEWLSSSRFAAEVTPDQILNYLNGAPAVYSPDERSKKLEWMIRQAKSLSGK